MATFYAQPADSLNKATFYSEQRKAPFTMMTSNRLASGRTKEETHVTSGSTLYNRDFGSKMSTSRRDGRHVLLVAKPYSQNALMN